MRYNQQTRAIKSEWSASETLPEQEEMRLYFAQVPPATVFRILKTKYVLFDDETILKHLVASAKKENVKLRKNQVTRIIKNHFENKETDAKKLCEEVGL